MTRAQLAARLRAALPGWTVTVYGPWYLNGAKQSGSISLMDWPAYVVVNLASRKYSASLGDWRPLPSGRGWPERLAASLLAARGAP